MDVKLAATISLGAFALGCTHPEQTTRDIDLDKIDKTPAPVTRTAEMKKMREQLHSVVASDGVSAEEAEIIAQSYFFRNVGCGMYTGITDGNHVWIVEGGFGYAGTPIKGFYINKQTGKVTSPIGPSYDKPKEILP